LIVKRAGHLIEEIHAKPFSEIKASLQGDFTEEKIETIISMIADGRKAEEEKYYTLDAILSVFNLRWWNNHCSPSCENCRCPEADQQTDSHRSANRLPIEKGKPKCHTNA